MFRHLRTICINDQGCSRDGFLFSLFARARGLHTWAAWRHETKRGSDARTFDIAFLRGPGPPQRGAGSINRISGRLLIIYLCTPVRQTANPRESKARNFLTFERAPRENPISAPVTGLSSPSYPWNVVVSCCGRITDRTIAQTIVACAISPYISLRGGYIEAAFLFANKENYYARGKKRSMLNCSSERFRIRLVKARKSEASKKSR